MFGSCRIERTDELRVVTEFFEHAHVLSTNWAVHDSRSGAIGNCASRSNRNRAVDDRQCRFVAFDVPNRLTNKVGYLKWITNVQNLDVSCDFNWRDVYP